MSSINMLLATHYLPHVRAITSFAYHEVIPDHSTAEYFADLHVFMWKMSLTEENYDIYDLRRAITRSGYGLSYSDLEEIDAAISAYLFDLVDEYGCHLKEEMRVAIAVAGAGLQFSSAQLAAA